VWDSNTGECVQTLWHQQKVTSVGMYSAWSPELASQWPKTHSTLPLQLQNSILEILCIIKLIIPKELKQLLVQNIIKIKFCCKALNVIIHQKQPPPEPATINTHPKRVLSGSGYIHINNNDPILVAKAKANNETETDTKQCILL